MLKLTLSALAASTLALAVPATAQVHIGSDRGGGVGIHVSPGSPGYRAHARTGCREVTTRTVRPNGNVVVKKRTVCR